MGFGKGVLLLIILLVVDLEFWGFTGCAVFEVFCQFIVGFCEVCAG